MDAALQQLSQYGVWIVGLNVLLQQLGLPIPSVPTMMVAGALAATGRMNGAGAFAISVAASLAADMLWFAAGRRFGYPVLRFLCRVSLSPDTCVRQTEGIFERWGFYSVVLSKFVPGFSTVAPPIAGALRMPAGSFLAASFASASLWVGAAMTVGYLFTRQIDLILGWMSGHVGTAALFIASVVGAYIGFKAWQRWRLSRYVESARMSIDELRARIDEEPAPFIIDIGSQLAQRSRPHIRGAVLLDLDAIARLEDFPRDREIVVYCACPNEASAKRAAQILIKRGYKQVRPLIGGIDAWVEAGHPVEHAQVATFVKPARAVA
ncbi:MAG TPA: DedA family protein/thiosulfate sulfurtransferase GlpE [Casimicrobiaceae bacterium]|nr:DedA family protein/thiosulfate sulfurtransferase GlpE [Casimicrobiaceae bacterium]